ncbi:MAG: PorP/SprF family type IX secretion system membrane protein [Algibacter sp.]|uniref:PorP/SprF family type IX secretion system membrane protein n=1 Tax=Algibacter sp. TaxID=1872428 RepID=UPI00261DE656|nr:PorP/SprF family type IX secretion system membrane protein [Algibacter sp.]MDG1730425.1 PorP/SprF family type IX secretion system membrane protein [Algibacter sp.]MDG2179544.1 PorP/SprF family type IX secretion system membrane protein [Algibacter sp.]
MKIRLYIIIILCCLSLKVQAQDPVFSQYFLVPETLNPGFSGFEDASYFGIMHRTQWPSLDLRVDTEYVFFNSWIENVGGIGFSIINQHENNTKYNHLQGNVNFAYHVKLANEWFFRPAIEVGFGTKSFNFRNLLLSDQININSGAINPTSSDPFAINANRNISFVDFSAGFVFDKKNTSNDTDLWLGASIKHLNKPNISFVENGNVPLDIFYSLHASYKFPYFDYNDMLISANYMQQGEYNRLDISSLIKLDKLMLGATAVTNPAKNNANSHLLTSINAFVGLELEQLRFGFSYDINTTDIGRTDGVYELSVTYLAGCLICRNPTNLERRK